YFSVLANFSDRVRQNIASFTLIGDIALSLDGAQVVVTDSCAEFITSQIVMVDIEALTVTEVTNCEENASAVSSDWSPDSTTIAYQSEGDIWLYDVASTDHTNLTESLH
ncbi:MAG: DPP IV N-terminal domain-containing protein, partial [Chloroflexota bacterium]